MITDKLAIYGAVQNGIMPATEHGQISVCDRAKNSNQPYGDESRK